LPVGDGLSIMADGLAIIADGLSIIADGLSIMADGLSIIADGLSIIADGLSIMAGGLADAPGWVQAAAARPTRSAIEAKPAASRMGRCILLLHWWGEMPATMGKFRDTPMTSR
jgi:uncharacterized phage infection (PIP) family protein YhgE